jgi:hypothetical protein
MVQGPDWRNSHFVTGSQFVLRFAALAVDPHLAGADHTVYGRLGNAFHLGAEKVVDALPITVWRHFHPPYCVLFNRL